MTVFLGIAHLIMILFILIFALAAAIEGRAGSTLKEISYLAWAMLFTVVFHGSVTVNTLRALIADEPTAIERME
jgi:hypothetical protein